MNEKPRAILTCVDYSDILAMTLPHTLPHVSELLVVTTIDDTKTIEVCWKHDRVRIHTTNVFYENGAAFNKGAAMEEGFDVLGRHGWILILDADIVLPKDLDLSEVERGLMWGCLRVIIPDPLKWDGGTWNRLKHEAPEDILGYFQLFHADDVPKRPWYPVNYRSAATVDQWFGWNHFPNKGKYLGAQTVLHLGPPGDNWCGRTKPLLDGTIPDKASERLAALHHMVERRMAGDPKAELLDK
jgi:hypothetical protein